MRNIYPIILSGGAGTRLWPLSRRRSPKQLLSIIANNSLIQETALRTVGAQFAKPLIICHAEQHLVVADQMRAIGIVPENIVLEPVGRNTGPAAAVAALLVAVQNPDAMLLLMPADHAIHDLKAFHDAIITAQDEADRGRLVTFGIIPQRPDTGYGYIQRGRALRDDGRAFVASRFVEKPDSETAGRFIETGDYYWNSGIFLFRAATLLAELETLAPEILAHCQKAVSDAVRGTDCICLARDPLETCKSISIDYAVMEHTDKAAVIPVEMGWSDVGSWSALWEIADKDNCGNVLSGDVIYEDTHDSYLRSDGILIAAIGVKDLVVVASSDAILVCSKSATQDVKKIVGRLENDGRNLHVSHRKTTHSWGSFECIDRGENFHLNMITVNPGASLALQAQCRHSLRWVVISGIARISHDHQTFQLKKNETCTLSGSEYQLENVGAGPLRIVETDTH